KLNPLPFGSTLVARTTLRSYDFFWQDTWRMTPSFTMTYGLSYGWQTTPQERDGKQALMVDAGNGNKVLTAKDYLDAKAAAQPQGISTIPPSATCRSEPLAAAMSLMWIMEILRHDS